MAAAATRTVTGALTNLSVQEIADAVLRFDLKPDHAIVDDTIVIGVQNGEDVGELVEPLTDDGSFTVELVAQENPTFTIIVTAEGPNIEAKNPPTFEIYPPPAAGSGDVGIGSLVVPDGSAPDVGQPFRLVSLRDVSVTDLTDGDVLAWSAAAQLFLNTPQTGGAGGGVTEAQLNAALASKANIGDAPTNHAGTHATGGSDPLTAAAIGAATAAQGAKADSAVQPAALAALTPASIGAAIGGTYSGGWFVSVGPGKTLWIGTTDPATTATGWTEGADTWIDVS